jgi:hypothetical protein
MADLMAQLRLPISDRTIRRARARAEHCMIFEARGGEPTYLSRALASHSNGRNAWHLIQKANSSNDCYWRILLQKCVEVCGEP